MYALQQEVSSEGQLNLNLEMGSASSGGKLGAAMLRKCWGVLPGPAACTVRGPKAPCQPQMLGSSSAASQQQGPCPCCALLSSSVKAGMLPGLGAPHPTGVETTHRGKGWGTVLCAENLGSSAWERRFPDLASVTAWADCLTCLCLRSHNCKFMGHRDHVYRVLNIVLRKSFTIIRSNPSVGSIKYPFKRKGE